MGGNDKANDTANDKVNVRSRVLAAAVELFSEQGYAATSVQQVVTRAGVTKGALYHYFSSKEDLLFEIYATFFAGLLTGLDRILGKRADPETTLRAIIEDTVVGVAENIQANAVLGREISRIDDERWRKLQADWRHYQEAVRQVIRAGQDAGMFSRIASPEVVTWSIFGLTNSMSSWYRPDGPKSARELAQELADLVLIGLKHPERKPSA